MGKATMVCALLAAVLFWSRAGLAQDHKVMKIWGSFASTDMSFIGFSSTEFITAVEDFRNAIEETSGYEIEFKLAPGVNYILKKFQDGEADFGLLARTDYYVARRVGIPLSAMTAPILAGSAKDRSCLWGRKELKGKPLIELKGATCGLLPPPPTDFSQWPQVASFTNLWDYFNFRWILAQNGADMPIDAFCGSLDMNLNSSEVGLVAAALGNYDIVIATEYSVRITSVKDKRMAELAPLFCGPEGPTAPFVYNTGIDPELIEKFREMILTVDLATDYSEIQRVLSIDGIVPVRDEDYDVYSDWFDECLERGYMDELKKLEKELEQ